MKLYWCPTGIDQRSMFVMWMALLFVFSNEAETNNSFALLNTILPGLKFTQEKENNSILPFLDVYVYKCTYGFLTAIYRKPTSTGFYIRWDSFFPPKWKINLIKTLTHRALMICSKSKFDDDFRFISDTLCENCFPERIVRSVLGIKIYDCNRIKPDIVQKCPVYLRLPWLGEVSDGFAGKSLHMYKIDIFLPIYVLFFKLQP